MSEKCTTCDKPIEGHEVFGPYHFPMCYACYCQHEQDLIDIMHDPDMYGKRKKHAQIVHELRALHNLNGDALFQKQKVEQQIEALDSEIDDLYDEIGYLKKELSDKENRLDTLRQELRNLTGREVPA